jgi:hypothetical protein
VVSSPAILDGIVYIGSEDFEVYALNTIDGSLVWKYMTDEQIHLSFPPLLHMEWSISDHTTIMFMLWVHQHNFIFYFGSAQRHQLGWHNK